MSAEYRELIDQLRAAGFTLREGKHQVWRHESGAVVVIPRSPSDHRSFYNDRANVRRALRRAQEVLA